ncbi:MAG: hypothetical protein WCE23_14185 [Candidatus Binatus sp.]|uniref:WD40/YVTN/BNR-like repeat-containing protein n=1 Tax=Candidatus Binatus sp. TaxID=2811406 RepID=UPI003C73CE93
MKFRLAVSLWCPPNVTRLLWFLFLLVCVSSIAHAQGGSRESAPFRLTWSQGKCVDCQFACELGRIQFTSRNEAWAIGCNGPFIPIEQGDQAGDCIIVHTEDAGRTWREMSDTDQRAGDADGPPAFSFLDQARGWIAWWNPADDPKLIRTEDGGKHWQDIHAKFDQEPLQRLLFFDEKHAYGTLVTSFFRTDDGGHAWTESKIPHIQFIDRMFFLSREVGWIAGSDGAHFFVFRTDNGGRSWQESQPAQSSTFALVVDLFFLDQNRGWVVAWNTNVEGPSLFTTIDGGKNWMPEPVSASKGKGNRVSIVRFVSKKTGFIFASRDSNGGDLIYTTDGGSHWSNQILSHSVFDCQVFEGDLLCSAGAGKRFEYLLLTLHPY